MQKSRRNLVMRAGKKMRNNDAKEGAGIIGDANSLLGGLCTQVGKGREETLTEVVCNCVLGSCFDLAYVVGELTQRGIYPLPCICFS